MILEINHINVHYGAIHALKDVSFKLDQNEIIALIGANGAGKSTALRAISGLVPVKAGSITFDGKEIKGWDTSRIVSEGIVMVPEGRRVFPNLTVLENLKIGAYLRKDPAEVSASIQYVFERFPRLKERDWQMAGTLSGGEQQMLAVGRAFMSGRKIMLLDEPSMGLAPLLMKSVFDSMKEINRKEGTTILVVEQNARMALQFARRGYVLENGRLVLEGKSESLLSDPQVKKSYLGG